MGANERPRTRDIASTVEQRVLDFLGKKAYPTTLA
jgi:hypothetical protein